MSQNLLHLDKRPCHLSNAMSVNTEKHGETIVSCIDFTVDGLILKGSELNDLLGSEHAHHAVFIPPASGVPGSVHELRFPILEPLRFKDDFEKATVTVWLGLDGRTFEWEDCKVRSIVLTPEVGGLTKMKCSIRAYPGESEDDVESMRHYLRMDISIGIQHGRKQQPAKDANKQQQLGMSEPDDADGEDDAGHAINGGAAPDVGGASQPGA